MQYLWVLTSLWTEPSISSWTERTLDCEVLIKFFWKDNVCSRDSVDDFAKKNDEFYNPNIKKVSIIINNMPH